MNEHEANDAQAANPYAPPEARLAMVAPAGGKRDLASRGVRLAAVLIDSVVLGVAIVAMTLLASSLGGNAWLLPLLIAGVVPVLLLNAWMLHARGQTVGKKLVGIRIVRSDRTRCSLGRIVLLRTLPFSAANAVPVVGPLFNLVDALMIFGDDHRTLHDRVADTVVVTA